MSFSENKLERPMKSCSALLEFLAILKNSPLMKPEKVAAVGWVEVGVIYESFAWFGENFHVKSASLIESISFEDGDV